MPRPQGFFAAAAMLAVLLPVAAAQAQQGNVSSSRLMFDPSGLQGSGSRPAPPAMQSSPTTGQNVAPRQNSAPAVSQTAAPKPPAARTAAAPKPPARATASAPTRPAAPRPTQAGDTGNRGATGTSRTSERPIPREQPTALGRVTLPGASLGYENQTQIKAYDLSDGRRVPGYDNIQRNDSSYFGLSLRMPTGSSLSSSSSSSSSSESPFGKHGLD